MRVAVFSEPLSITRSAVSSAEATPSGIFALHIGKPIVREGHPLLSVMPERPNVLVRFTTPIVLRGVVDTSFSPMNRSPFPPPVNGQAVTGAWFRFDHPDAAAIIQAWTDDRTRSPEHQPT